MQTVVIIGAGFSGTMLAAHLLRLPGPPRRVVLIERSGRFGRGVAYGTGCGAHVLNVPAGRMNALPADPDHFLRWAQARDAKVQGGSFLPRMLYGEYLGWTLEEAERTAAPGAKLERIAREAVSIAPPRDGHLAEVSLDDGRRLACSAVILALGNFSPGDPPVRDPAFFADSRYIRDPWASDRLAAIPPGQPILLIGTGLTMVDIALQVAGREHRGHIYALSRRGLLPQPHRSPAVHYHPTPPDDIADWPPTALGMLRALRSRVRLAAEQGIDWREVVTSIRADTPRLWTSLPLPERRRFMERLRAFWETHRHRAAPEAASGIAALLRTGQLRVRAGRLLDLRGRDGIVEAVIRPRGEDRSDTLRIARVINCTGPQTNLGRVESRLVADLLGRGLIAPDELGLGALTSPEGAAIGAGGVASEFLFACGPLRKAQLWENTAVPELRGEAAALAATVLGRLGRGVPAIKAPARHSAAATPPRA